MRVFNGWVRWVFVAAVLAAGGARGESRTITLKPVSDVDQVRCREDLTKDSRTMSPVGSVRLGDVSMAKCDPISQYIVGFELPALPPGTVIDSAWFSFRLVEKIASDGIVKNNFGWLTHNVDLWMLGTGPSLTPPLKWFLGDAAADPGDARALRVQNDILVKATAQGEIRTSAEAGKLLLRGVAGFYADEQNKSYSGGSALFLRLNPDRAPTSGNKTSGYAIDGSTGAAPPVLTIVVTEPPPSPPPENLTSDDGAQVNVNDGYFVGQSFKTGSQGGLLRSITVWPRKAPASKEPFNGGKFWIEIYEGRAESVNGKTPMGATRSLSYHIGTQLQLPVTGVTLKPYTDYTFILHSVGAKYPLAVSTKNPYPNGTMIEGRGKTLIGWSPVKGFNAVAGSDLWFKMNL
jgi:hypothetical protein